MFACNDIEQVRRVPMTLGNRDDHRCADLERPEELPHRHVERRRRLLEHHVLRTERILVLHPRQAVDDRRVRYADALRATRRTRGEDDVREVLCPQRCRPLRIGHRCRREFRHVRGVDVHRLHTRELDVVSGAREHPYRRGRAHDVLVALRRLTRVDGYVRGTGLDDRVHADEQLDTATDREADRRIGSDTHGQQVSRQAIRARVELRVRQPHVLEHQGLSVGGLLDASVELSHQCCPAGDLVRRPRTERQHRRALDRVEQVDLADGCGGRCGDRTKNTNEPFSESGHRRFVEEVRGIGQGDGQARGLGAGRSRIPQRHLQIELRQVCLVVDRRDGQAGEFDRGSVQVLERQHHLEQRVPCLRAHRGQHVHQTLERHLGVRERGEVHLPRLAEQIVERRPWIDFGAQHQCVDEHPDDVVEGRITTAGDRSTDTDVVGGRELGQQHGQCGVHDHERRCVVVSSELLQLADEFGVDLERVCTAVGRGDRRAWTIGG